jgi:hypothetical protein
MSDFISRQAAIDEIEERKNANGYRNVAVISELNRLEGYIMRLPSAQPEHDENDLDFVQPHKRIPVQLVVSSDCISRQAAIDALKKAYWDKDIQSAKDDPCIVDAMTDWAIRQVKALLSAQPDIIHCGECKHRDPEDHKCDCGHDILWQLPRDDKWYCADAERRTDGN